MFLRMYHFKLKSYIIKWVLVLCCIASGRIKLTVACPDSCSCLLESGSLYTTVKCDLNGFDQNNYSSLYPFVLPINTTVVELQSVETKFFLKRMSFIGSNWDQVVDLTINGSEMNNNDLSNTSLNGLDKLKVLRIHNLINAIESGVFLNTPYITILDLSMNPSLRYEELIRALRNTLPKLEYLDISYIQSEDGGIDLYLGPEFTEIIDSKNIQILNVSGTKLITFDEGYLYPSIQVLNITRCILGKMPSKIWPPHYFPNLRELDVSRSNIFHPVPFKTKFNRTFRCEDFPRPFLSIYAHELFSSSFGKLRLEDGFVYISCGYLPIEFLDMSSNNIEWLNISTNAILLNLKTLIVSRNSMKYISPKALYSLPNIRILRIDRNNLGSMQYFPDFNELFASNTALETLDFSYNYLSFLPRKLFVSQKNLRELNLNGNRIVHFDVELDHLLNLITLDLSNNGPVMISYTVTRDLEAINVLHNLNDSYKTYFDGFNSSNISFPHVYRDLVVNLQGNMFTCTCEHISFLLWLAESTIHFEDRTSYKCGEEFHYKEIYKDNIRRLDDYCNLQKKLPIIIVSCIIGAFLIIFVVLIMKYAHRRGIGNKRRRQYVNNYDKFENEMVDLQEVRYPAFLSFCSDDNDVAKGYFYPMISKALQSHFGEKEVLALGETIFKPGKLINIEIEECFSRSDVILFLITLNFLQSDWCRYELNQADLLRKPAIYLVENTVLKGKLPVCLRKLKTHTRATWTREGNDIKISPDWNLIAKQVLDFAVVAMLTNRQ